MNLNLKLRHKLAILFWICILAILGFVFLPPLIPEIKENTGEQLNGIWIRLFLAYISAYIFYLLVVNSKEKRVRGMLSISLNSILEKVGLLLIQFYEKGFFNQDKETKDLTKIALPENDSDIQEMFENIKTHLIGIDDSKFVRFLSDIDKKTNEINREILDILRFTQFLDPDIINSLVDLKNSNFHNDLLNVKNIPKKKEELSSLDVPLKDYVGKIKELRKSIKNKL